MSIALVANTILNPPNASGGTTSAIDTTGANLIVIAFGDYTPNWNPAQISDNKSNTWTALTAYVGNVAVSRLFYCERPTVGTGHTFTTANQISNIAVAAFSGLAATGTLYESGSDHGAAPKVNGATSLQPGSATPGQAGDLIVTSFCSTDSGGTPITVDSSFAITDSSPWLSGKCEGVALAWKQGTASAENPTWHINSAGSADLAAAIAIFKGAASGFTVTVDVSCSMEFGSSAKADIVSPEASSATLKSDIVSRTEYNALLRRDDVVIIEFGIGAKADTAAPINYSATLRSDLASPLDSAGTLRIDSAGQIETGSTARADIGATAEYGTGTRSDISAPIASGATLKSDTLSPVEWTGSLSVTIDAVVPLEFGTGVRADIAAPATWLSTLYATARNTIAFGSSLFADLASPIGVLSTVRKQIKALIEWTGLGRSQAIGEALLGAISAMSVAAKGAMDGTAVALTGEFETVSLLGAMNTTSTARKGAMDNTAIALIGAI